MEKKMSLWKEYNKENERYEHGFPPAFPWHNEKNEDKPRYIKGEDNYYYVPNQRESGKALLSLTGDLMCEPKMCRKNRYGDTWFFHPCFQYIRKIFKSSDLVVGNLETTITDQTPYAGEYHVIPVGERWKYHCNGPESYLDAVRYAGYDVLVNANNHNCDSGISGLFETLERMDKHNFLRTGAFLPGDDRVLLVKVNGIKIAILSYGSRYNDLDDYYWTREGIDNVINYFSAEKAQADVKRAREMGAEFVMAYIHWGIDYQLDPNEKQMAILPELAESGVDYIVGSHTHCLQHFDTYTTKSGKVVPLTFSMGNFITNEVKELCKHTGILQLVLERVDGEIKVKEYFMPAYVFDEMGSGKYTVVPVDSFYGGVDCPKLRDVREYVRERIKADVPEPTSSAITLAEVCDVIGADAPEGSEYAPITKLCVRPFSVIGGALYFANGNENDQERAFIKAYYAQAVVAKEEWPGMKTVICDDPLAAYEKIATHLRSRFDAKTVLIAGGYGKTEIREKIAYALSAKYGVLTQKDEFHIDSSVWQNLHPYHDYCVMEIRPDEPTAVLSRVIKSEITILTGTVSVSQDESDLYVKDIVQGMAKEATLFYNAEDEILVKSVEKLSIKKVPFTLEAFAEETGISIDAFDGFVNKNRSKNTFEIDGINLILDIRAKMKNDVVKAIDKAAENGEFIAVLGTTDIDNADLTEYAMQKGAKLIISAEKDEREKEIMLLANMKKGDTLVVASGRKHDLNFFVRRIFGINDHYIRNGR